VASAVTINGIETVAFDSQKTRGEEASLDAALTDQWHILVNAISQDPVITHNPQGVTSVGNHPRGHRISWLISGRPTASVSPTCRDSGSALA
jgi:iron complex outermembrane recepter protein